jgi:hypothetical protein
MTETSALQRMTFDQVQYLFDTGRVSEDQFSGYQHAWRTSATGRLSTLAELYQRHESITPEAQAIAAELGCCKSGE